MLRGRRLSTEEKAQISALNGAGFGIRAIGRQIGRTHCLISAYLRIRTNIIRRRILDAEEHLQPMMRGRSADGLRTVACR
ncbi:hypothetical protein ANCDUO_07325 [Ancylostoma duodenale]|uniref:Transposase IS30-like HTH domain-containing protein n=1 Tax=Ancylostoma duodenale TaxID=51022 RepID=A0A0C2GZ60_9BILA|nr:hypothetical protein ANCDUO_07325 [Ancylostoma duodenale]